MKRTFFAIGCVLFALNGRSQVSEPAGPGWLHAGAVPFVQVSASVSKAPLAAEAPEPGGMEMGLLDGGEPEIAEFITDDIRAVARGLHNRKERIFDFVLRNIRYVHYFGCKKGAHITLLERSGNDFDQCALLVALLRAAVENDPALNYTVSYEFGAMKLPYEAPQAGDPDLRQWLGLTLDQTSSPDNWGDVADLLNNLNWVRGCPKLGANYLLIPNGDPVNFIWLRPWVKLVEGTSEYYLDPAFKTSERLAGLDIPAGMQFNGDNFLASIANGASITADWVQTLNTAQLTSRLGDYTANLLTFLDTVDSRNRSVQEVISGFRVNEPQVDQLPTALRFPVFDGSISTSEGVKNIPKQAWDNIPASYMSRIRLVVDDVDITFNMPELHGRKLSLTFVPTQARISLDDVAIQTGTTGSGTSANCRTYVYHPFGTWNYTSQGVVDDGRFDHDDLGLTYQRATAPTGYVMCYGFDDPGERIRASQQRLDAYKRAGLADTSAEVVTETLHVMGLSWIQQSFLAGSALGAQKDVSVFFHHRCGRAASESGTQVGFYVDLPLNYDASCWIAGPAWFAANPTLKVFEVSGYFASAFEHGVLEQWQENPSASTIKALHIANQIGKKLIRATGDNWDAMQVYLNAEPPAGQYTIAQRNAIRERLNGGSVILLPSNTNNPVGLNWKGYGYIDRRETAQTISIGMIIKGGYSGGFAGTQTPVSSTLPTYLYTSSPTFVTPTPAALPSVYSWDPVNMADGAFVIDTTDLATGQSEPRGFSFTRHYSSNLRYHDKANMARGWTHNYVVSAAERSDPLVALGKNTPQEMASMIVGLLVAYEVFTRTPDTTYPESMLWATTALVTEWAVDQIVNNAVSVTMGAEAVQFVKQPTGASSFTYVAPAGITMTLSKPANYVLQQRHGNTLNFNNDKRLQTIVDPYGKTMTFYYNNGRLDYVQEAFGRILDFEYDDNNRLKWIDDNDGTTDRRRVSYGYSTAYSSQGDLTTVTDAEGKSFGYEYDGEHKIHLTKDGMATPRTIVENVYDSFGRVIEQRCQGDPTKTWILGYAGFSSIEVDPEGAIKTYYYDEKHRSIGQQDALGYASRVEYDGQDHVIRRISAKNEITEFEYDALHNLIRKTEALGVSGLEQTTLFFYEDAAKHLTRIRDFRGHDTVYVYNNQHQVTSVNGPDINNNPAYPNIVQFGYYATDVANGRAGNLEWQEDQAGHRTTYYYDQWGQITRRTLPDDGNPATTDYETFTPNYRGDVEDHLDFRGKQTITEYNNRRQVKKVTLVTSEGNVITEYQYDNAGNLWKTIDPKLNVVENQYSATAKLRYRILPEVNYHGSPTVSTVEYQYDSRDWLWKAILPITPTHTATTETAYYDTGWIYQVIDPLTRAVTYGYDENGRKTTITSPLPITPPQTTTLGYNARGKHVSMTDANDKTIEYRYDANGNREKVINRLDQEFVSTYYDDNRLWTFKTPLQKTTTTTYTQRGLVHEVTPPSGVGNKSTYQYDSRGRLEYLTDGVTGPTPAEFSYDANGNLLTHTEGTKTITRTYDDLNRVDSYSYADTANPEYNYTLGFHYDKNGNLDRLTYPGGVKEVTYAYDSHNRLETVTDWNNRVTTFAYDLAGRLEEISRPNNTRRVMIYDDAGQMTHLKEFGPDGRLLSYFELKWDDAGRIEHEFIAPIPAASTEEEQHMTPDADNRIATFNGQTVVHDDDGNMTTGPLASPTLENYTYDARNRLQAVGGLTYTYDQTGNRIGITENGQTTRFGVNPTAALSQVLVRTKRDGSQTFYVYGMGLLYEVDEQENTLTYHYDYRGSTVAVTDDQGIVRERMEYSTYGRLTRRAGEFTVDTPFLFNGRYGVMSDVNGLYHMRARYYNPYLRRFINADPIGFEGGMNWYAYADGNPISMIDPSGHVVETVWDVANIGMGVYSLQDNVRSGNWGWAALDAVGLVYDGLATAVPFLPAGASAAFKAGRAGNTVVNSVQAGYDVARVAEATHQTARTFDAVSTVPWQAALDGSQIHRQVASQVGDSLHYFDSTYMAGGANRITGPRADMMGVGVWADITTPRQWADHFNKYQNFGTGIPITYERGVGVVNSTRLLPGAGVGLSVLK